MLTGLDVVRMVGRTFTLKHGPTGFTFNIGPTGNPFTPLEGESDQVEELIFRPLELGKAAEVRPRGSARNSLPTLSQKSLALLVHVRWDRSYSEDNSDTFFHYFGHEFAPSIFLYSLKVPVV